MDIMQISGHKNVAFINNTQHWVRKDTRKYQTSSATLKVKLTEMLFSKKKIQKYALKNHL